MNDPSFLESGTGFPFANLGSFHCQDSFQTNPDNVRFAYAKACSGPADPIVKSTIDNLSWQLGRIHYEIVDIVLKKPGILELIMENVANVMTELLSASFRMSQ